MRELRTSGSVGGRASARLSRRALGMARSARLAPLHVNQVRCLGVSNQ
jgi:hypothetical protein